ncbi:neurexin-4-like [Rhopilema esculentum]|uniref:neurexin-4-like n=1 Tax=Rhopilema esculentum TaxID=499914 RepID=UPI0031DADA41
MLQSVQLIHFLLMITSARVAADSFFLGEHGGNAEGELSITESHFACDRRPGCMAVKYDKKTKQSQLIQENGGRSIIADKNEIVWKKVRFKSCKEALPSHLNEGEYWIQHMNMEVTVRVRCKREEGKVLAMFDHDSEAKVIVDGFEKPDYYIRVLKYKNKLEDMIAFVNSSIACKQFTRFDCIHMLLEDSYTFLSDRNGKEMLYIGGGPPAGTGCSCGITNTCASSTEKCNCDENDLTWRYDEGYVTEKERLPLTKVSMGDTGSNYEKGAHTIGKLICEE